MKFKKTFTYYNNRFFWDKEKTNGLCVDFIKSFIDDVSYGQTVEVTVSTNNPKRKNYRKIVRNKDERVMLSDIEFIVCYAERTVLNDLGIGIGDSFWIKVELL